MNFLQWSYTKIYHILHRPGIYRQVLRVIAYRQWVIIGVHLAVFASSYLCGLWLVHGNIGLFIFKEKLPYTLVPLLIIKMAIFFHYQLFQGLWRYVSFEDLLNIIRASIASLFCFYGLGLIWAPAAISEYLYCIDFILTIVLVGGIRMVVRNIRENLIKSGSGGKVKDALLVGPVQTIFPLVKEMLGNPSSGFNPVAILDPENADRFSQVRLSDVRVFTDAKTIESCRNRTPIDEIILCWPQASRSQLDAVVDQLQFINAPFKKIPHVEELLSGKITISEIRDVEIHDLLDRPSVRIDMAQISDYLSDKVVLVSGGGGSIGSELCHQIASYRPKKLVVVERSESNLYALQLGLKEHFPQLDLMASISTINDRPGIERLMREQRVEVVFHAAAYKHVPLMEAVPVESSYNNIVGTYNLVTSAVIAGVRRFVMISTDKAVNPTNIMGVTKRIAEMIVQSSNVSGHTKFMTVRFGNVLGSAGSVIPIFKKQLLEGKPLTVTHPRIERFFMTIPEAVQLVLQAGCMGGGGEIFVLDMGKPMRILALAEKLIALSGKRPYQDVKVKFTGLRPGEKMYEELFTANECLIATEHPRIRAAACEQINPDVIQRQVRQILRLIHAHDAQGLIDVFTQMVPTYCPSEAYKKKAVAPPSEKFPVGNECMLIPLNRG